MKISVNQIPLEGLTYEEEVSVSDLDLETEIIKFCAPIKIKADISKITNAVTVHLTINGRMLSSCSRCLEGLEIELNKNLDLNYSVTKEDREIDLDPDIREEIVLGYPIKPLCRADCRGLCPKCGKNLNIETCDCKSK